MLSWKNKLLFINSTKCIPLSHSLYYIINEFIFIQKKKIKFQEPKENFRKVQPLFYYNIPSTYMTISLFPSNPFTLPSKVNIAICFLSHTSFHLPDDALIVKI